MDLGAADQYCEAMYGSNSGYVAAAYKDKDESWQERQFLWPRDRGIFLEWARLHTDTGANIFVCPGLRHDPLRRHKGDGKALRWLWADVDMDKVPADKQGEVKARMERLGTVIVASGTPGNAHVYVRLTREVSALEHLKLNTGLRDYLSADNKHTDNSLLRLPGTFNHKDPAAVRPVARVGGHDKAVNPASLLKLRAWQRIEKAKTWEPVDVKQLLRNGGVRTLVRMSSDMAEERFGSRHKAVSGVVRELVGKGYDRNVIHTLMDDFPAAIEKRDHEHGAYDVHKDIDRLLGRIDSGELEAGGGSDDESEEGGDDFDDRVEAELRRREIRRRADQVEAERQFVKPPEDISWSLAEGMENPPERQKYLIDGIAGKKHNVILVAQYKTGKTTFVVANLCRALVDGEPFLGEFAVADSGGVKVGHWNCEMDAAELLDEYARPAGFKQLSGLEIANLRGYPLNILTGVGKAWAVQWLKDRAVKVWTIDSLARIARMAGVNENDNHEMLNLLMTLDDIKVEAGVDVCVVIAHTGRGEMAEGSERARAATVIDDWPDARWVMTRDGDVRFLAVDGRGVKLETTALKFDEATGRIWLGFGNKHEVRESIGVDMVYELVKKNPGMFTKNALVKALHSALPEGRNRSRVVLMDLIDECVELGFIKGVKGARNAQLFHPVDGRPINFGMAKERPVRGGTRGRGYRSERGGYKKSLSDNERQIRE